MTTPTPPAVTCERCKGTGFWETGPHSGECSDCRGTGNARTPETPPPDRIPEPSEEDLKYALPESYEAFVKNVCWIGERDSVLMLMRRAYHAERRADLLSSRARAAEAERDKLQVFKDWVHAYLDTHGVPHHPPGSHGAHGCRIGDRMDWVMSKLQAAEADAGRLRAELDNRIARLEKWRAEAEDPKAWDYGLGVGLDELRDLRTALAGR